MEPSDTLKSDLASCVKCGLCLTSCPTYRASGMEGYSPRGRIAAIRMVTEDPSGLAASSPVIADYLDTCLGCRACESVCPSGVPYGRILEHTRDELAPGGIAGRLGEGALLWTVSRRWRLSVMSLLVYPMQKMGLLRAAAWLARRRLAPRAFANAAGIPPLRLRNLLVRLSTNYTPPDGVKTRGQVVLFTGCVQDAWSRDVHWATIAALTRTGLRVRMPHRQGCCGALHAHTGHLDQARALARGNLDPLEQFEGRIVVNAAGCGAKLKEYAELLAGDKRAEALARRVRDVSEVLRPRDIEALGARPPAGLERIAVHDPCHLSFVQEVREPPRALLRAAGYEVVDLPDGGQCCGAAGTYALQHPEWAVPLRDDKLDACRSVPCDAVAVGNPGCLFWMASGIDAPPMYHPVQLVAMALVNGERQAAGDAAGSPGATEAATGR